MAKNRILIVEDEESFHDRYPSRSGFSGLPIGLGVLPHPAAQRDDSRSSMPGAAKNGGSSDGFGEQELSQDHGRSPCPVRLCRSANLVWLEDTLTKCQPSFNY